MTDKDISDMIARCISEITSLRTQVDSLTPRAAAYDSINQILGLLPRQSQGAGIDIVWQLRRQLEELKPTPESASAEAAQG